MEGGNVGVFSPLNLNFIFSVVLPNLNGIIGSSIEFWSKSIIKIESSSSSTEFIPSYSTGFLPMPIVTESIESGTSTIMFPFVSILK